MTTATEADRSYRGTGASKAFEAICLEALTATGHATASRYGVQGSFVDGEWRPISSLPDFEGVLLGGRQFIVDCKVISGASFDLRNYRHHRKSRSSQRRQLEHMLRRDSFGAICGFVVHCNSRRLKTKSDPSGTFFVPISSQLPLWEEFERGERHIVTRSELAEHSHAVEWRKLGPRDRKGRPDLVGLLRSLEDGVR